MAWVRRCVCRRGGGEGGVSILPLYDVNIRQDIVGDDSSNTTKVPLPPPAPLPSHESLDITWGIEPVVQQSPRKRTKHGARVTASALVTMVGRAIEYTRIIKCRMSRCKMMSLWKWRREKKRGQRKGLL